MKVVAGEEKSEIFGSLAEGGREERGGEGGPGRGARATTSAMLRAMPQPIRSYSSLSTRRVFVPRLDELSSDALFRVLSIAVELLADTTDLFPRASGGHHLGPNEFWPSCFAKLGQTICCQLGHLQLWPN